MKTKTLVQLLIVLSLTVPLISQTPTLRFQHKSVEDGLSQNTVPCIIQDRLGFMWIGTRDGLNKYDGYDFKIYKSLVGSNQSISSDNIQCLMEDSQGHIWIGTVEGGLIRFDPEKETFQVFQHDPSDDTSIGKNHITAVAEDDFGALWIGTTTGLIKYDIKNNVFTEINPDELWENLFINDIIFTAEGLLWVGT